MDVRSKSTETTDFLDSDGRRCPVAGSNQTWRSYERDLKVWILQSTLEKRAIAAHVLTRGFARNPAFLRFKPLLDLTSLGTEDGFTYLCTEMAKHTQQQDPLLQLTRFFEWLELKRNRGEPIDVFITKWTVVHNHVQAEKFVPIQPMFAALVLFLACQFTKEELSQITTQLTIDSTLTVEKVVSAITKTQIVPNTAALQQQRGTGLQDRFEAAATLATAERTDARPGRNF